MPYSENPTPSLSAEKVFLCRHATIPLGHDGHTALLLAVAKWMAEKREAVKPNIVFLCGKKSAYPHHHPKFDIDEEEIGTAIDLFLNLVKHFA